MTAGELSIREATPADRDEILDVASRSLGWAGDERDRAFFRWKHERNPFGSSPAWVAEVDKRVVGFRTFLRWRFERGADHLEVVRAVDTATDPAHQGRGIFTRLTLASIESLADAGVHAVFNTPNEKSRPGYLKMGWAVLGRPRLAVRPRKLRSLARMVRSRSAADKWSEPCTIGERAVDALAAFDPGTLATSTHRWSTLRSEDYLRWRYGFEPLHYRAIEVRGGLAIFRVRRRGPSREVLLCEWLSRTRDRRSVTMLARSAGDYVLATQTGLVAGFIPLPRQGPVVTWRPLDGSGAPRLGDFALSSGDLELL